MRLKAIRLSLIVGVFFAFSAASAAPIVLSGAGGVQIAGATMTFGAVQAQAFVIDTNNGSANVATADVLGGVNGTTAFMSAQLGQYASGLAVTTIGQGGDNSTASPENAMDNQLAFELIIFKLPDSGYAFSSLKLNSVSGGAGTGTGDADIAVWIGGEGVTGFDFFVGKTLAEILGAPDTTSLSGSVFQQLNLELATSCAADNEAVNASGTSSDCNDVVYTLGTPGVKQPAPGSSDAKGLWLMVGAGFAVNGSNLVDRDDNVLVSELTLAAPAVAVPVPGSLVLMIPAIAGFVWSRTRKGRTLGRDF